MSDLLRWHYLDPCLVLERKQERSCQGCKHEQIAFDTKYCDKGKKHGKKCKFYLSKDKVK